MDVGKVLIQTGSPSIEDTYSDILNCPLVYFQENLPVGHRINWARNQPYKNR